MADITVVNLASVPPPTHNSLGTQLLVWGQLNPGGGAKPTCLLQNQTTGETIATGDVYISADGTLWWARFGPLTTVNGTTAYQLVANAATESPIAATSVTIKQLYFTNLQISITSTPPNPFPLSFEVQGTTPGAGWNVVCRLLKPGTGVVAFGAVSVNAQNGQWTASFNVPSAQSGCQLEAELIGSNPAESVAATWIDGINVGT